MLVLLKVSTSFPVIDLDDCGESKGCLLWPNHCSGNDCLAAVTHSRMNDQIHFEMKARAEGYVSVGFSYDQFMVRQLYINLINMTKIILD